MKRDGACTSLWQHSMPEYRSKTKTLPKQAFDVIIVGGGITGLTTALQLQKAGKKCLLAEAHTIGFGTTGGTTAHLNTFMDTPYYRISENFGKEAAGQIASGSLAAIDLIKTNIKQYSIDCGFEHTPGYIFAQNEEQNKELEDIFHSTSKAGVDIGACDFIPVPVPFTKALLIKDQAKFHPAHYIYALAEAFEDEGGMLIQGCRVTAHEEKPEGLQVSTSLGTLTASNVIYATHIPTGINLLQFYCAPYRSYAIAVKLTDGMYPVGLAYDLEDPYHY
ncbi:MAG: FAD-binding oxidoreductase, partial [Cytophagales bacterium]|nr:FAD-binding oxidoreductase [Cytophaga sp.]